jgi:hypothetical protein
MTLSIAATQHLLLRGPTLLPYQHPACLVCGTCNLESIVWLYAMIRDADAVWLLRSPLQVQEAWHQVVFQWELATAGLS